MLLYGFQWKTLATGNCYISFKDTEGGNMISKTALPAVAKLGRKMIFCHIACLIIFMAFVFGNERPDIYGITFEFLLFNIIFPVLLFFIMGCFLPIVYIRVIMKHTCQR